MEQSLQIFSFSLMEQFCSNFLKVDAVILMGVESNLTEHWGSNSYIKCELASLVPNPYILQL